MSIGQIVVLLKVPLLEGNEGEKGNSSFAARRRVAPFHRGPANNFRTFLIVRSYLYSLTWWSGQMKMFCC